MFVVNSLSSPPTNWDESEAPPGTVDILLKATGVPIDHYSYEAVELLKDTRRAGRRCAASASAGGCERNKDPELAAALRVPRRRDLRDRRVVRRS